MLRTITLDGFRSFAEAHTIDLAPITVLAGPNNVGKSSVIAALACLVQSAELASRATVVLNGQWVSLESVDEVVNYRRSGKERWFEIGVSDDSTDVLWRIVPPADRRPFGVIQTIEFASADGTHRIESSDGGHIWQTRIGSTWQHRGKVELVSPLEMRAVEEPITRTCLALAPSQFRYLGPYRAEPEPLYRGRTSPNGPPLGIRGEYVAEYLSMERHREVHLRVPSKTDIAPRFLAGSVEAEAVLLESLRPNDAAPIRFAAAIDEWWSYVFDARLAARVEEVGRIGYTLKVQTPSAEDLSLRAVGLGLSQTLPILALVLGSSPGDVLAIETPEAHLHPAAQHRLAHAFIAAARAGRQIIIETHSEHMVNAIRIALKKGGLEEKDIAVHFFHQDEEGVTVPTRVTVDQNGRIKNWPRGFFDQEARELLELL